FACQGPTCGQQQDVLSAIYASGSSAPCAPFLIQGWSAKLAQTGNAYGGRFFAAADPSVLSASEREWELRKKTDLAGYWPRTEVQTGLETTVRTPLLKYGYSSWASFFNARQLLAHSLILKAIHTL